MTGRLNHTIVWCRDKQRSARFLTELFDRPAATPFGPFLIDGDEFDASFGRIRERDLHYWADPGRINHHDGGRGGYFEDPDGHLLEILTRPYGSG